MAKVAVGVSPVITEPAAGGSFTPPPPGMKETFFFLTEAGSEYSTEDSNNFRRERNA